MTLWATHLGGLEIREAEGGETRLRGLFPYGQETTLREAGPGYPELREVFLPGAFVSATLGGTKAHNVHLLAHHDFARPLASVRSGTLVLHDRPEGLEIEAVISPEISRAQYAADVIAAVRAGLTTGISPGFRLAQTRKAEEVTQSAGAIVRLVRYAALEEISLVTRPAYPKAQIEARSWQRGLRSQSTEGAPAPRHFSNRWR